MRSVAAAVLFEGTFSRADSSVPPMGIPGHAGEMPTSLPSGMLTEHSFPLSGPDVLVICTKS